MVDRYPGKAGRTEYGGGDGQPQRLPDGASLPLEDLASGSRVSERARLMRTAGMADFDPARVDDVGLALSALDVNAMSDAQREAYLSDLELSRRRRAERAALEARTNGYVSEPETYVGESGEGNGVTTDMVERSADPSGGA